MDPNAYFSHIPHSEHREPGGLLRVEKTSRGRPDSFGLKKSSVGMEEAHVWRELRAKAAVPVDLT